MASDCGRHHHVLYDLPADWKIARLACDARRCQIPRQSFPVLAASPHASSSKHLAVNVNVSSLLPTLGIRKVGHSVVFSSSLINISASPSTTPQLEAEAPSPPAWDLHERVPRSLPPHPPIASPGPSLAPTLAFPHRVCSAPLPKVYDFIHLLL